MHTVQEALSTLATVVQPIRPAPLDLDAARGHYLAQDVVMDQDAPPFDRAQLDGYAVRAAEASLHAELEIVGRVDAGGTPFTAVPARGQCVGINTGAPLPAWADAVLMIEHTTPFERTGTRLIAVTRAVAPGYGIQRRGADVRQGQTVLHAGARLNAAQLAVCAAAGVWQPAVRRVRVAVMSTGDELIEGPGDANKTAGIRNSNGPMLRALVTEAGGVPLNSGSRRDDPAILRHAITDALAQADMLVVCGGMSMGTRDYVPMLLKELGATLHIEKVRMKPGKPFVFASLGASGQTQYVAGLPGNPVSSFVTFQRFVREVISRMAGSTAPSLRQLEAVLKTPLDDNGDREFFQPCSLTAGEGVLHAEVLAWKGSADLFTLARAEGLIMRPAHAPPAPAGSRVQVLGW